MKKVLILSLAYFPKHVGGAEVSIKEITDRIQDIEFHLICNRYDATLAKVEKFGNVTVHRIGFARMTASAEDLKRFPLYLNKPLYQFLAAWTALRLHREHRFDAMWAMMAHSCGVPAAIIKMVHPEIRYVLNLQEGDPIPYIERKMRFLWPLFKRAFTKADIIQCLSTYLAGWARARDFKGVIEIVPNGVDVAHFSQSYADAQINEVRDMLGKRMGDVYLVSTSRMVAKNALDDVIRALAHLPPHVKFVNFGFGPDRAVLEEVAKSAGVADRVQLLDHPGLEALPKYLRACDVFVRPSRSEGFGISFVEAMAAGLPVIATQEGGIADFLFDEKRNPGVPITGWAVDKDVPEQVAQAVRDIMENPEKVRAVVATARQMVTDTYDWNHVAARMRSKVFAPLLGEKSLA